MRWLRVIIVALLTTAAPGETAPTPEQIKDVAQDLVCLCGTCNRESLSTCQCGTATSERDAIGDMLEANMTRQQIVDSYVDRFGPMGLANPPEGYDVVWVVPFAMLAFGIVGVRQVLVYWRGGRQLASPQESPHGPAATAKKSDVYDDRLHRDLNDFES